MGVGIATTATTTRAIGELVTSAPAITVFATSAISSGSETFAGTDAKFECHRY